MQRGEMRGRSSFLERLAKCFMREKRRDQRNQGEPHHVQGNSAGRTGIAEDGCGYDRREPAGKRGSELEARRSSAVANARPEQFGKVGRLRPEHGAMA